jgi:CubicO group peptidase (beta-lactamase class C family)
MSCKLLELLTPSSILGVLLVAGLAACIGASNTAAGDHDPPRFSEYCPPSKGGKDDWRTGSPGEFGFKTATIEKLVHDARSGRLGKLHSVLVIKDGALVVEEYFRGASRDHCQFIASITKSLTSILVGMSLERSPGRSVATPLIEFFPQYAEVLERDGKSAITLAHALTMTAGLDWDEYTHPHPHDHNPNTQMYRQSDPKRFILDRKQIHPPGHIWAYNSGLSVIVGATVDKMTGQSIDKFAEQHFFAPLGIDRYHWFKHADGTVYSNGDLLLTPQDLAKVGLLVLNNGQWQGRQIVSRRWLAESTRPHTTAQGALGYGYHWWQGSVTRGGRRVNVLFGSGTGGQRLFIVPDLNMVVVITSQVFENRTGPFAASGVLTDYVIPAALSRPGRERFALPDDDFLQSAVGTYLNSQSKHMVRVVREKGTLFLQPDPVADIAPAPSKIQLTPSGPKQFQGYWNPIGTIVLDFVTNNDDVVTGGTVNIYLRNRSYRKID